VSGWGKLVDAELDFASGNAFLLSGLARFGLFAVALLVFFLAVFWSFFLAFLGVPGFLLNLR
jgi:hypothetical protein